MGWGKRKSKKQTAVKGVDLRVDEDIRDDLEFAGADEYGAENGYDEGYGDQTFGDEQDAAYYGEETVEQPVSTQVARIGSKVFVKGELSGEEDIHVEGRVEGSVYIPNNTFEVGPNGRVKADVDAHSVVIEGEVVGNVRAADRVEVAATGSLIGDIQAARVVLAEGARFKGAVDMSTEHADGEPMAAGGGTSFGDAVAQSSVFAEADTPAGTADQPFADELDGFDVLDGMGDEPAPTARPAKSPQSAQTEPAKADAPKKADAAKKADKIDGAAAKAGTDDAKKPAKTGGATGNKALASLFDK